MGIQRALSSLQQPSSLTHTLTLFFKPSMLNTLASILLITASSMIVNDYYDARNGVDEWKARNTQGRRTGTTGSNLSYGTIRLSDPRTTAGTRGTHTLSSPSFADKPLASGQVPLPLAKRFLSTLYATLLLSVSFVPGIPARLSIVTGAMMTFWYTQRPRPSPRKGPTAVPPTLPPPSRP